MVETLKPVLPSHSLPTPSPSPPTLRHPPRRLAPSPPQLTIRIPPSFSTRSKLALSLTVDDNAALKEKHVAHARRLAEQVRMLQLARAVYSREGRESKGEEAVRMTKYSLEVERGQGEEKVMKRITVIVPGGPASLSSSSSMSPRGVPYFLPARQPAASSSSGLTFIPPPSSASTSTRRRLSLDSLFLHHCPSTTSSLTSRPRLFRHANPPPPSSLSSSSASAHSHAQRRRPALTLRQSAAGTKQEVLQRRLTKDRVGLEREKLESLKEEEVELEGVKKEKEAVGEEVEEQRTQLLMERRGKVVEPLRLG